MNTQQEIGSLSHFTLARTIMNRLWWAYDYGGISLYRAERAALLESVMNCSRMDWRNDDVGTRTLLDEANSREPLKYGCDQLVIHSLRLMPFEAYTCLVLEELRQWYDRDLETEIAPGHFISIEEKNMVDIIARILNVREMAKKLKLAGCIYTRTELIAEGRERCREYVMNKTQGTQW